MNKRKICEKELCVLWNALLEADGGANNTMMSIASVMQELILDLVAPEPAATEDHFADPGKKGATLKILPEGTPINLCERKNAPEEEEKAEEPPVLIYEERGEKTPCPVCGEPAVPIKNKPGVVFCKRCGGPFVSRRANR